MAREDRDRRDRSDRPSRDKEESDLIEKLVFINRVCQGGQGR